MDDIIKNFMRKMKSQSEKEYMYSLITYGIAPTLCGYKASTLITLSSRYKNTYNLWKEHKEEFLSKVPLRYFELNRTEESLTVLFYDDKNLNKKMEDKNYLSFLKSCGYIGNDNLTGKLDTLKERYIKGCPHEIGLFLDIPLEDVLGFIRNKGKNYLYCGYWKVYCNLRTALKTFENYDKSKRKVINLINQGKNVSEILSELELSKSTQAEKITAETLVT